MPTMLHTGQLEMYHGRPRPPLPEVLHTDGRGRPSYEMSQFSPREYKFSASSASSTLNFGVPPSRGGRGSGPSLGVDEALAVESPRDPSVTR